MGKRDGKRRRLYFHTPQEAEKAFKAAEKDSEAVGRKWAYVPPEQRAELVKVLAEIKAAGVTLRHVWDTYQSAPKVAEDKPLGDAITALVLAKTKANKRPAYVTSLEQYLTRWAKGQEARPISAVTFEEIDTFVNGLPSMSSRATAINRLSTLFSFAIRKGWRNDNPCKRLERPHVDNGTPSILTVEEAKKILQFARAKAKRFLPWLVLAMFGGVRPEEADKLTWDAIDLKRGLVKLDDKVTKTRMRRNVHLKPVAVQWLKLGGDLPLPKVTRRRWVRKLRNALGWEKWKKDVLRHSAASYWLASDQDAALVAMELGNSVDVLKKHYMELVTDEQAKKFWQLTPKKCKDTK
jgi:site-specific recombinase XerD